MRAGGAFRYGASDAARGLLEQPLRLVVLAPFFLDRAEVTVREMRRSAPTDQEILPWSGRATPATETDRCVYTFAPDRFDDVAIGECVGDGPANALPPGSFGRDRLLLDGGELVDLAGNVAEWTSDAAPASADECWSEPLIFDPVCAGRGRSGVDRLRVAHGGSFDRVGTALRASTRRRVTGGERGLAAGVGFRCARDAAP